MESLVHAQPARSQFGHKVLSGSGSGSTCSKIGERAGGRASKRAGERAKKQTRKNKCQKYRVESLFVPNPLISLPTAMSNLLETLCAACGQHLPVAVPPGALLRVRGMKRPLPEDDDSDVEILECFKALSQPTQTSVQTRQDTGVGLTGPGSGGTSGTGGAGAAGPSGLRGPGSGAGAGAGVACGAGGDTDSEDTRGSDTGSGCGGRPRVCRCDARPCVCKRLGVCEDGVAVWSAPALPGVHLPVVEQVRGVLHVSRVLPARLFPSCGGDMDVYVAPWCVAALTQLGECVHTCRTLGLSVAVMDDVLGVLFDGKQGVSFRFLLRHAAAVLGQGIGSQGYQYTHAKCDTGREVVLKDEWPFVASLRLLRTFDGDGCDGGGSDGAAAKHATKAAELAVARRFADALQDLLWACARGIALQDMEAWPTVQDLCRVVTAVYGGGLLLKDQVRAVGFVTALLSCSDALWRLLWEAPPVNGVGQLLSDSDRDRHLKAMTLFADLALALKAVTRLWPMLGGSKIRPGQAQAQAAEAKYRATRGPLPSLPDMQQALQNLRAFVARVQEPGRVVARGVAGVEEDLEVQTRFFGGVNLELVVQESSKERRHPVVTMFLDSVAELKNVCENTPCFA